MKKFHLKSVLTMLVALFTLNANAYDVVIDGIYYNLNYENYTAGVDGCNPSCGESIAIPDEIIYNNVSYSVTSIDKNAFYGRKDITSVTIGNNVVSIGDQVFLGCNNLSSITIGRSLTSVGESNFSKSSGVTSITFHCKEIGKWFCGVTNLKEVFLGEEVTSIGNHAFNGCNGLTSITIPSSVTSIGQYAFRGCSRLTSLTIPNNVTSIGIHAFESCNGLSSITIPNSVTNIEEYTFASCWALSSVTISNSVTSIGDYAFYGCDHLTSLTIPNSVTSIGICAFQYCTDLTSLTIYDGVTILGSSAFDGCTALTDVTLNNNNIVSKAYSSLSTIGSIFGNQVTKYILGENVTRIGDYAFNNCTKLVEVSIGENVTSIGDYAFYDCSLTSVSIPNSVSKISSTAFQNNNSLASITIEDGDEPLDFDEGGNFYHCGIRSLYLGRNMKYLNDSPFRYNREGLNSVTLGNNVTELGDKDFFNNVGLTELTLSKNLKKIGNETFYACKGLESLTIPNSVTEIGFNAFSGCKSLKEVVIEDGQEQLLFSCPKEDGQISLIGQLLEKVPVSKLYLGRNIVRELPLEIPFLYTDSIDSLTIGKYVTDISDISGHQECSILNDFICYSEEVPKVDKFFKESCLKGAILHVPYKLYDDYCATTPWNKFGKIVNFEKKYNLTYIYADEIYKKLVVDEGASIVPEKAPEKDGYTFTGWNDIPEIMPNHNVEIIGSFIINKYKLTYIVDGEEYKIYEVEYGTVITAEDNPTKFGFSFSGWSKIPETMPARNVTITGSFMKNSNMFEEEGVGFEMQEDETLVYTEQDNTSGNVEIPEIVMHDGQEYRVTAIAAGAFKDNANLTELSIPESIVSIGDNALAGCANLETIRLYSDEPISFEKADASSVFCGVDTDNCVLYVPAGSAESYRQAEGWKAFKNIVEMEDPDEISDINTDESGYQIYTLDGKQVETLQKGVNIIRYSNGSTQKVYVK